MILRSSARNCSPNPNQDCNNSPFLLSFSLILDLIQEYSLPPEEKQNIAVLTPVTSGLEYPDMLDHAILNMQLKEPTRLLNFSKPHLSVCLLNI